MRPELDWHRGRPEAGEGQSRRGGERPLQPLAADAGRWLAERDVCMVASDNAAISGLNEHQGADESLEDDLHMIFLWRHGIYLAEMLWLEELAAEGQKEFLFIAAPLAIDGGSGSPINPIAVL
jgi:kynurenine formamidase